MKKGVAVRIVNTEQERAWNGYEGQHWADNADRYDGMNRSVDQYLLAGVRNDADVLEIGCGAGQLTHRVATRTTGRVLGVDLSQPMLRTAAKHAPDNVTFEAGDAQVFPFPPGEFDLVLSRFGIMFFADPVAAFRNIRPALRPGNGELRFICMREPRDDEFGQILSALANMLPGQGMAVTPGQGPLSLADPEHTRSVLSRAGFTDINVQRVPAQQYWGPDADAATEFFAAWGPVRFALEGRDPQPVKHALRTAFARFARADGVHVGSSAWLVTARPGQ